MLKKLIITLSVTLLLAMSSFAALSVNKLGSSQVQLKWDTITNATGYKVTANAQVKNMTSVEWTVSGTNNYYTWSGMEVNAIYQMVIVPIIGNKLDWAKATNAITITPKSLDFYTTPIYDMYNATASSSVGTGFNVTTTTVLGGDAYVDRISVASATAGVYGIYVKGVLVDTIVHAANSGGYVEYKKSLRIGNGETFTVTVIAGGADTRYVTYRYFFNNKFGL